MDTTKYAFIGFLRAVGFVALVAVLQYVGDATHLSWLGEPWDMLLAGAALAIEHAIEAKTGRALFGAVRA